MDRNFDRYGGGNVQAEDSPDSKWLIWGIWAGLSLVAVLIAVLVFGFNSGLLLGWVVGIIITAMLMVFRR
jgi:hypothetical protein